MESHIIRPPCSGVTCGFGGADTSAIVSSRLSSLRISEEGNNDGWSTPEFTRKHNRVKCPLSVEFVDGGKACADGEMHTFMKYFHLHDCNMDIVRGGDWCKANPLRWTDRKCAGRNMYGPTLQEAYDRWVASGRAAEVDAHKQAYLGYIQALL